MWESRRQVFLLCAHIFCVLFLFQNTFTDVINCPASSLYCLHIKQWLKFATTKKQTTSTALIATAHLSSTHHHRVANCFCVTNSPQKPVEYAISHLLSNNSTSSSSVADEVRMSSRIRWWATLDVHELVFVLDSNFFIFAKLIYTNNI
jgi:hypothetical protein